MTKIDWLKNYPETIPELAQIWYEGIGKIWLPDVPIERVEQKFHEHLNTDKLPLTFVAMDENKPVGMCSLRENDGIRPDLMPWLGGLVVHSAYQKNGVAQSLINATKQQAKKLGFEKLYLSAWRKTLAFRPGM